MQRDTEGTGAQRNDHARTQQKGGCLQAKESSLTLMLDF